jgi:ABC-type branched-subunit amino acid transport system ATPase component
VRHPSEGLTVVLSEPNLPFAVQSDRAAILEKQRIRYTGSMEQLTGQEDVHRAFLGA